MEPPVVNSRSTDLGMPSASSQQGISQLHIVQGRLGEVTLNVVPDHEYGLATKERLIREIRSVFERETTVTAARLTAIPQERNGKYRFAICRVPHFLVHPSASSPTVEPRSRREMTLESRREEPSPDVYLLKAKLS